MEVIKTAIEGGGDCKTTDIQSPQGNFIKRMDMFLLPKVSIPFIVFFFISLSVHAIVNPLGMESAMNNKSINTIKVIVLDKNIQNIAEEGNRPLYANLIIQEMIDIPNTKYVIKWDFDLNGTVISIPDNCILEFDGGSFNNGTIVGENTVISAPLSRIFSTNTTIAGTWKNEKAYIEWFGAVGDGNIDDSDCMRKCLPFKNIELQDKTYLIKMVDIPMDSVHIWGIGNATIYNNEWGPWCFRTSNDHIEIDHISFKAIPHTKVTRSYPGGEFDNGACAVLAKGSYCKFHDLYIEEFYSGIWIGGDYLGDDHLQEGNELYNIKCHNINFNPVAWQRNFVAHDITGDCSTFTPSSYNGIEKGIYSGNPCHLLYLTGKSYNTIGYNISSSGCQGGSTIAVKGVENGFFYNVVAEGSAVIQATCLPERPNRNVFFNNIICRNQTHASNYIIWADNNINCTFNNIETYDKDYYPIIRIGKGCVDVAVSDLTMRYDGDIIHNSPNAFFLHLNYSRNTIVNNVKIDYKSENSDIYAIFMGTGSIIRNVTMPINGRCKTQ